MTKCSAFTRLADFPNLYLSEQFKRGLSIQSFYAQLTGSGKVRCCQPLKQLQSQLCISMPLRVKLFQDLTTAGHFDVMSLLCYFYVKSIGAIFSSMQQL